MTITKVISEATLKAAANLSSNKVPSQLLKSSTALFSAYGGKVQALPDLAYDYGALEPVISAETMTIHHSKHHATYVTNLNKYGAKMRRDITFVLFRFQTPFFA